MRVKVTVDGKSYSGVDSIAVGGKTLAVTAESSEPSNASGFKTYTTTSTGMTNGLVIDGVDLVDAKMFIVEFKSQSPESPVETGYITYGGILAWFGGLSDELALAESLRTATSTQGGQSHTRSLGELGMYGLTNTNYFNATNFSGNFKLNGLERTSTKTTIQTVTPINPNTVFDVVVHYM